MDNRENLTKKERRELKRQERRSEAENLQKKKKFKKFVWWLVVILILAFAVYGIWLWMKSRVPSGEDFSQGYPISSRDHIQNGSTGNDYVSNPPTSGQHWPNPLARGIYADEQADEQIVHNLEHGEIWISYHPRVPAGIVEELEKIARRYGKIVMAPRSENDTDIALASWGRLDKFDLGEGGLDKARVEDFIKRYVNQGPEFIP